jgi:glucose/arabinose dehydrogenase
VARRALPLLALALLAGCSDSGSGAHGSAPTKPKVTGVGLKRIGSFDAPVYVTAPPKDPTRLFVVEQAGRIRVIHDGHRVGRPFLDIRGDVQAGGERGLLSMAFPPDYASSRRFYVYYTDHSGDIRIRQFRRSARNANVADAGSGRNVLRVGHRTYPNHNGGQLEFGPDGMLYAGFGDGGGEGDPFRSGQRLDTLLAKLIRIDPKPGGGYRTPSGNPFAHRSGARREIWAYGLRNPYRFSFDRQTGDLTIGDVGQDEYEEVDFARSPGRGRGVNYGWSVFEGFSRFRSGTAKGRVKPKLAPSHRAGFCALIGGYVVRDARLASLAGRYVYGDNCKSEIYSTRLSATGAKSNHPTGLSVSNLSSFGEDARGRVYASSLSGGVYRFVPK